MRDHDRYALIRLRRASTRSIVCFHASRLDPYGISEGLPPIHLAIYVAHLVPLGLSSSRPLVLPEVFSFSEIIVLTVNNCRYNMQP